MIDGGFGAFGELPFAAIRDADSQASIGFEAQVLTLAGVDGFEYLVELFPFQRPE